MQPNSSKDTSKNPKYWTRITCKVCDKEVTVRTRLNQMFCSCACAARYRNRNNKYKYWIVVSCKECGKDFDALKSKGSKFCSKACCQKYFKDNNISAFYDCSTKFEICSMGGIAAHKKHPGFLKKYMPQIQAQLKSKKKSAFYDPKLRQKICAAGGRAAQKTLRDNELGIFYNTKQKSDMMKKLWSDDVWKSKQIKCMIAGLSVRPTSFEERVMSIIQEYRLPFEYVGDNRLKIGRRNPDFIDKADKIIIEVYFSIHKLKIYDTLDAYEHDRYNYFKDYGYHTLFLNEDDILCDDWKTKCLTKITRV